MSRVYVQWALATALCVGGCVGEVSPSTGALIVCGPMTNALVSEAGGSVGSIDVSSDHIGLDFALATTVRMSNVRIYAGVPPSEGGPVPFGGGDLIMDNIDSTLEPAATSASFHLDWADLTMDCGFRVKILVKVTFGDGTVAWAHSAVPDRSYENVHWDYYAACIDSCVSDDCTPDDGCTLTQGFWKTHSEAWPVASLILGGVRYSQAELLALLHTPPRGDASIILVHQLIAAKLNVAAGAAVPGSAIGDADAWIAGGQAVGYSLPFGRGLPGSARAIALSETLDAYNNGLLGPPHCD